MKLTLKPHTTSPDMVEIWTGEMMWTACHVDIVNELDQDAYRAIRSGRTINLILMEAGMLAEVAA